MLYIKEGEYDMGKTCCLILIIGLLITMMSGMGLAERGDRSWFTLETEHFYIHYQGGYQELAWETAKIAERVHPVITDRFGHEPVTKTHVILEDVTDLPGGMASLNFYNVITLHTVPPVGYAQLTGMDSTMTDWLEVLIVHEYTHIVHMDMARGIYGAMRRLFGHVPGLSTPNAAQSLALIEGYATYEEALFSNGRGQGSFWDMFLRSATLEDQLLTMDQALGLYNIGRWNPAGGAYIYGYSWLAYLSQIKGDEAVHELAEIASGRGVFGGPNTGMQAVADMSLSQLDNEWRESISTRYQRQQKDIVARGITPVDSRGSAGWFVAKPQYSPDGRYLAYEADYGPVGSAIRIINLDTDEERVLAEGAHGGFAWSHDGRHIIYSTPVIAGDSQRSDLFAVNINSGETQRLTYGLRALTPAISPCGSRIAFLQLDGTKITTNILVAPLDLSKKGISIGKPEKWFPGEFGSYPTSVAWHPDSEEGILAVEGTDQRGAVGIYLLNYNDMADYKEVVIHRDVLDPILVDTVHIANPIFTSDGRYLLFESDETGVTNIYSYDLLNDTFYQLTNVLSGAFFPAPSPNGKELAMTYYTAEGYEIATMELDFHSWRLPQERFSGLHWERASWKNQIDELHIPDVNIDTEKFSVSKYSPIKTLIPTWWLPIPGHDGHGPTLGITTGINDARRQHSYLLSAEYGLVSGTPGINLSYTWDQNPWVANGWDVRLSYSYEQMRHNMGQLQRSSALFGYMLDLSENWKLPNRQRFYGGIESHKAFFSDTSQEVSYLVGGWSYNAAKGADETRHARRFSVNVNSPIKELNKLTITGTWAERLAWRQQGHIHMVISAGYTQNDIGLSLGSASQTLGIRGLGAREIETSSSTAMKISIERQIPVFDIYRGIWILPTYFEQLSLVPFVDMGILPDSGVYAGSIGCELRLDTSIGYGFMSLTPWIGGAYVYGGDPEKSSIRLIGGIKF